ncbi:MAG: biotin/lipoyl-binding protein [Anaerolineaceae bacterium]|nr:biotin/lipoyl-binding protein [Anaerolineaceae bacterium]
MIRKMLIANRGEIACRIIRTCREMGIATVAVYADADAQAWYVEMADEAVHLGGNPPGESYLNGEKIIAAALRSAADAIHPGYGFLAENADFAQAVIDAGLVFIGPPPEAIAAMGKKRAAKQMLKGIPVVPGYMGDDQSDARMVVEAAQIGYPMMVKASAGGGGKGMRQVETPEELPAALEAARREALQAFGDDTLILERVIRNPRHIEVQIFGDQLGNIISLGERECTIQRRHQKIIEETPSTALPPFRRAEMCAAAVSVGAQLNYYSAGTVEFLVDEDRNFYFMEMNTRLQVEHPITEEATGVDLVRWQITVAEGYPLPEMDVYPAGHAIEARIYAEDPANEFLPVIGKILHWHEPDEVRVDSGVRSGDTVSVYYDPMLAKIIAYGEHREGAIRRLDYALSQLQFLGLRNNVAFLRRVLLHPDHLAGNISTTFIPQHPDLLHEDTTPDPFGLIAAALAKTGGDAQWRNNANRPVRHTFLVGEEAHTVALTVVGKNGYAAQVDNQAYTVQVWGERASHITLSLNGHRQTVTAVPGDDETWWVYTRAGSAMYRWVNPLPEAGSAHETHGSLHAPMPGQVRAVLVTVGQQVAEGDVLLILEAMKMEHRIKAPYAGEVTAIHYAVDDSVPAEAVLLELK